MSLVLNLFSFFFNWSQRAGRTEEEIEMLQFKLKRLEDGTAFGGRRTKTARSQGKKVHISVEEEKSRYLSTFI